MEQAQIREKIQALYRFCSLIQQTLLGEAEALCWGWSTVGRKQMWPLPSWASQPKERVVTDILTMAHTRNSCDQEGGRKASMALKGCPSGEVALSQELRGEKARYRVVGGAGRALSREQHLQSGW
jgi:hypothetical protein